MTSPVIIASHLGKAYKQYPNKWARLLEWILPYQNQRHHLHWVLKDVSFELKSGEALGIIGVNGAGKSTLLKMLTGITRATTGTVSTEGRVAALLELGMGFHPEFTGRQNAMMAGQLLGYAEEQMVELMPEIEAFAGIGSYMDQPVRVYSSGMQVRLAFSVATAVRPDILIVDEALSVGDTEFQHRSYDRIRRFREQGTALLFVSHDKGVIINLCDRAILLDQGRVAIEGDPEVVMDYYNAMLAEQPKQSIAQTLGEDGKIQTQSGSGEVTLLEASLCSQDGSTIELAKVGQTVCVRLRTACVESVPSLVAGFMIKDRLGQVMYGTNTFHHDQQLHDLKAGDICTFSFTLGLGIGPGTYSVSVALHADDTHIAKNYLWLDRVFFFTVVNGDEPVFVGSTYLPAQVRVEHDAS
jgi:lipopolysaccharide transport system ATP-binding protein